MWPKIIGLAVNAVSTSRRFMILSNILIIRCRTQKC